MTLSVSFGIASLFLKLMKLVGNHLEEEQQNPKLQKFQKSQSNEEANLGTLLCHIATQHPLHEWCPRHGQKSLRKTSGRSYGSFGTWMCPYAEYSWMPLSKRQFISEMTMIWIWETWRIILGDLQDNISVMYWKVDQLSDRAYCYKSWLTLQIEVDIDKLVAQSNSSIRHCQLLRLLRFGAALGDDPNKPWKNKIQWYSSKQVLQRTESNWWKTHGVRVEDLHRIQYSGQPQWDSENDGRITMWSSGFQRNLLSSCQCLTTLYG